MPHIPTAKQVIEARLSLSTAYNFATAVFFMEDVVGGSTIGNIYLESHSKAVADELRKAVAILGYDLVEKQTVMLKEHESVQ